MFDSSELIRLDERDIRGGTLVLRRLRPPMSESRLGDSWVEVDVEGLGVELLSVSRKGTLGGYEVSGLSRWYSRQGVRPGDRVLACVGRFGLSISKEVVPLPGGDAAHKAG